MDLFNVRFTYDGQKLRGASGLTAEAIHAHRVELPTARWMDVAPSDDICALLDLVIEQLAVFSDNLYTANRQLRRRREQQQLW
jgi:hypothetical protein